MIKFRVRFLHCTHGFTIFLKYYRPKRDGEDLPKNVNLTGDMIDYDTCALSADNTVLSGTQLKNTEKLFAVCVYGGRETKVVLYVDTKSNERLRKYKNGIMFIFPQSSSSFLFNFR